MGARFSASFHAVPGSQPASYTMGNWIFPGVKWPEDGINYAEVKTRVQLYLYSPCIFRAGYRIAQTLYIIQIY